jgi:hypothetical protein
MIQIQQTFARIGIQTTPRRLDIQSPQAELNLHQEPARIEIRRTPGELQIDQSEAFADADDKTIFRLIRDEAARSVQEGIKAIGEIAERGDEAQHIERKQNVIAEQAARNVGKIDDFNVRAVPEPFHVKIHYQPTVLQIQASGGQVTLNPVIHKPDITVQNAVVQVYLAQRQSITITPPAMPSVDLRA